MEGQNGEVASGNAAQAEGSQQAGDVHGSSNVKCSNEYLKSCGEVLGVPDEDDLVGKSSYDAHDAAGTGENSGDEDDEAFQFSTPTRNSPDSVNSCDLDRHSPLQGSPCMDCSDAGSDDGRGSGGYIDTTSHSIRGAVAAGITSSWVSSGGECFGSLVYSDDLASHHGLGYHGGVTHHPNSPTASPHLTSVATGGATPSFHGPLLLPGSVQSKTHADVDDDLNLGGDNGLFGVPPSCDLGDFADLGGARGMPDSSSGEAGPKGEKFVGPMYGPALPWQPFTAALENTNTPDCGDVKGESTCVAGECGLQNLGNTCFMAAGLQCLVNTPPFAEYFFSEPHSEEPGTLVGTFSELVHKMWSARYTSIRPTAFKHAFGNHWRDFRDYRQHDCQEFVTLLLEGLRKQMSLKIPKKINNDGDDDFYETPNAVTNNTTFGGSSSDAYSKCSTVTAANASTVAADSLDPGSSSSSPDDEPDILFGPTWITNEAGALDGEEDGRGGTLDRGDDEETNDYNNRGADEGGGSGINRNMFLKNLPGPSSSSRHGRLDGDVLSSCLSSSSSGRESMRRGGDLSSNAGRGASINDGTDFDDQPHAGSSLMIDNGEEDPCSGSDMRRTRRDCSDVDLPPNLDTRDSCRMEIDDSGADEDLATLLHPSVSSSLPSSPPSPRAVIKADEQSRGSGESQEEGCEDSGATSPKSSVSSSSVDSHLVNMRLQPIPEEVLLHAASSSLRQHKDRQANSTAASSGHSGSKDKQQRSRALHPSRHKDSISSGAVTSHTSDLEDEDEDMRILDSERDVDDDFLFSDAEAGVGDEERRRQNSGSAGDYEETGDSCGAGDARDSLVDSTNSATADEAAFPCDSNTNLNGVVVGKRKNINNSGDGGGDNEATSNTNTTTTTTSSSRSGNNNNNIISSRGSNYSQSNNFVFVSSSSDSVCGPIATSSGGGDDGDSPRTNNNDMGRGTSKGHHHHLPLPDVLQNTITDSSSNNKASTSSNSEVTATDAATSCDVSSSMDDYRAFCSPMKNQTGAPSAAAAASSSSSSSMAVGGVNLLDIMKETKTSNVNVLVTENPQNNELLYDSEKYAKGDKVKLKDTLDNLNRDGMGTVGGNGSLKRVKESNIYKNKNKCSTSSVLEDYPNGKTKRNNKLFVGGDSAMEGAILNDFEMEEEGDQSEQVVNKRIRLDEKNIQHELERTQQQQQELATAGTTVAADSIVCDGLSSRAHECVSNIARLTSSSSSAGVGEEPSTEAGASKIDGALAQTSDKKLPNTVAGSGLDNRTRAEKNAERDLLLAQESWNSFVGDGEGALLMDTLYGQFKSCLVCSVCGHSSVKFDPFGTLSVPLPHANETQVVVTYISSDSTPALKCLVTLCKISDVKDLKASLVQLLTQDYQRQLAIHGPLGCKSAKTFGSASPKTSGSLEDRDGGAASSTETGKKINASLLFGDEKAGSSDDISLMSGNVSSHDMSTDSVVGGDDSPKFESRMETDEAPLDASSVCGDDWPSNADGSSPNNSNEPSAKNTNVTEEEKISNVNTGCKNSVLKGKRKRSVLRKPPDVEHIVIAEVLDNHVAKTLEDSYLTKYVNQVTRSVYAFHLPPTPPPAKSPLSATKHTGPVSPMPDVVPTIDKMGSRNRSNLTLFEGIYNLDNQPTTTDPSSSSSTTTALSDTNTTEGEAPSLDTTKCCLKGGSKICGTARFGEYPSAAAAVAAGSGSFHGGGIDGGNASCSYPSSNSVVKPLTLEQVTAFTGGGAVGANNNTGGGGVNGGAAGGTTPNMSASTSGISSLGLPSTSSSYPSMDHTVAGMPSSSDGRRGGISAMGAGAPYDVPRRPEGYDDGEASADGSGTGGDQSEWKTCNICLEEMCQTELKSHGLCYDCLLCENCLDMSCKHHGGDTLPCPVCQVTLTRASLIPVAKRQTQKPKPRLLRVCVVFRLDADSRDNNKRHSSLLGHPRLVSLPSRLPLSALHDALRHALPPNAPYTLLLVDGRGYNCSRCLFMSHCRGCEVTNVINKSSSSTSSSTPSASGAVSGGEVIVNLQAGDTVCVRFTRLTAVQRNFLTQTREHETLALRRQDKPLTLYDCLRAFTRSETLECGESWFCPECECKQSATKTVSVWRCPPFLIIHLERFLFHGTSSSKVDDKVIFPLENLDMSDYLGGRKLGPHQYNLYGVVCHMGVAQAGHYTALARSPVTGCWRYYNDESVNVRKPSEDEYSSAYLLFYHRNNVPFQMNLPRQFAFITNACDQDTSGPKPEIPSSGATVRDKLPSPVVDVTDDDVMEYDKSGTGEADVGVDAGASHRSRYYTTSADIPDRGEGLGDGAVTQSSSVYNLSSVGVGQARESVSGENLDNNDAVASTSHKKDDGDCEIFAGEAASADPVPRSAAAPLEGTILDDWMEASIPTESSSMARTAATSTKSPPLSPYNNSNSPGNSSPSKSPRNGLAFAPTKSYSNPKQQQDGSSGRESGSSLELFTISSSDTSMDSNNTSGNGASLGHETSTTGAASSSFHDSAGATAADTSSSVAAASCSTSTQASRSPIAAYLQQQQQRVTDGEAHSTSDNTDEVCDVSSSSGATSSPVASMHRSYKNNNN